MLAYVVVRALLWRYKVDVRDQMRSTPDAEAPALAPPGTEFRGVAYAGSHDELRRELHRAPWRAALAPAIAAAVAALYLTLLSLGSGLRENTPLAATGFALLWPGVLMVALVAGTFRRLRWTIVGGGALASLALATLGSGAPSARSAVTAVVEWLSLNAAPTLYLGAFFTRRVRVAGPLVLMLTLAGASGLTGTLAGVRTTSGIDFVTYLVVDRGLGPFTVFAVLPALGALLACLAGLVILRRVSAAYGNHEFGDQGIAMSTIALVFILLFSATLFLTRRPSFFVLGLGGYLLYLLSIRVVRPRTHRGPTTPAPSLLLLRVFGEKGPTAELFHGVGRHWRHVGPIRMIGAWDLAEAAIEPNEFMRFLRGEIRDAFITTSSDIRRPSDVTARRDPDGRFRCEQQFCSGDVWVVAVDELMTSSAVILIDLRLLPRQNAGQAPLRGIHQELDLLADRDAFSRTVVLGHKPTVAGTLSRMGIDVSRVHVHEDTLSPYALLDAIAARTLTTADLAAMTHVSAHETVMCSDLTATPQHCGVTQDLSGEAQATLDDGPLASRPPGRL